MFGFKKKTSPSRERLAENLAFQASVDKIIDRYNLSRGVNSKYADMASLVAALEKRVLNLEKELRLADSKIIRLRRRIQIQERGLFVRSLDEDLTPTKLVCEKPCAKCKGNLLSIPWIGGSRKEMGDWVTFVCEKCNEFGVFHSSEIFILPLVPVEEKEVAPYEHP